MNSRAVTSAVNLEARRRFPGTSGGEFSGAQSVRNIRNGCKPGRTMVSTFRGSFDAYVHIYTCIRTYRHVYTHMYTYMCNVIRSRMPKSPGWVRSSRPKERLARQAPWQKYHARRSAPPFATSRCSPCNTPRRSERTRNRGRALGEKGTTVHQYSTNRTWALLSLYTVGPPWSVFPPAHRVLRASHGNEEISVRERILGRDANDFRPATSEWQLSLSPHETSREQRCYSSTTRRTWSEGVNLWFFFFLGFFGNSLGLGNRVALFIDVS